MKWPEPGFHRIAEGKSYNNTLALYRDNNDHFIFTSGFTDMKDQGMLFPKSENQGWLRYTTVTLTTTT
jgi:hypothetical protein